jgi:hypothetical protein
MPGAAPCDNPAVTSRHGGRPSQVRPRPPSTGRPNSIRIRARPPVTSRIASRRPVRPRSRLPLIVRLTLAVAVVVLGGAVLYTAAGGIGRVMTAVGGSFSGLLDGLTATPTPSASIAIVSDAPLIALPARTETNESTVDLAITVPESAVREERAVVRIYLALPDQVAAPIADVLVGSTQRLVVPITLTEGRNDFTATLIGAGGESESSPVVTYILDQTVPKITLASPKDGATVGTATVQFKGRTQAHSAIVARNEANTASATSRSDADGNFVVTLPVEIGTNGVTLTATDPAGNAGSLLVTVRRGAGVLTATLSASTYRLSIATLPATLELSVLVTDPAGRPVDKASVTFTLTIPGIGPISGEAMTSGGGTAVFRTNVPNSAQVGGGLATALVISSEFGTASSRSVITIVK